MALLRSNNKEDYDYDKVINRQRKRKRREMQTEEKRLLDNHKAKIGMRFAEGRRLTLGVNQ